MGKFIRKDTPVSKLELSRRTSNALRRGGIDTLEQLIGNSESELRKLRWIGTASILEIKKALIKCYYFLKEDS